MRRLSLLLLLLVGTRVAAAQGRPNTSIAHVRIFSSQACGVAFLYPAAWRVSVKDKSDPCSLLIRPADYRKRLREYDVDSYTVEVNLGIGSFDDGADAAGLYRPDETDDTEHPGEWLFWDGQAPELADPIEDGSCRGLKAWAGSRCYHIHDGYAGVCDVATGFVIIDHRWIAATGYDGDVVDAVLGSVVFLSPKLR